MIGRSVVRILLTACVLAGCGSTSPSVAPSVRPSTGPPTQSPPTPTAPSPSATAELTTFSAHDFTFDYPSDWRVIANEEFAGLDLVWAVGTGDWDDGCTRSGSATYCSLPSLLTDPGEAVMAFSMQLHHPYIPVFEAPPLDSTILSSGAIASLQGTEWTSGAIVYAPGREVLRVRAALGTPESDADRASVQHVIDSLAYSAVTPGLGEESWVPPAGQPCARDSVTGRLNSGNSPVLNVIASDHRFTMLAWPRGWRATADELGRAQVINDRDEVVATQWDLVEIGGRVVDSVFRVCPDAVTVLREFDQ